MDRRSFLYKSSIAIVASSFSRYSSANIPGSDTKLTIPEEELLGIVRPKELTGDGFNLRPKAAEAFDRMRADALKAGFKIYSVSSYRSFGHQQRIWNRKYQSYSKSNHDSQQVIASILEYSTIPGTSRHHWGTDLDIIDDSQKRPNDVLSTPHFMPGGVYEKFYAWLLKHANSYGFYLVYTDDEKRPGFHFEPWHWTYSELSIPLLYQYASIPLHNRLPLSALEGSEKLTESFLKTYVEKWGLGINALLIPQQLKS